MVELKEDETYIDGIDTGSKRVRGNKKEGNRGHSLHWELLCQTGLERAEAPDSYCG